MEKDSSAKENSAGSVVPPDEKPLRLEPQKRQRPSGRGNFLTSPSSAETFSGRTGEALGDELEWGGGARKTAAVSWFVLAGLLVVGVGLWAVLSMYQAQDEIEEVSEEKKELAENLLTEQQDIKTIQRKMTQAVSDYLGARTIEEKLANSRHPKRVRPLMEQFYQKKELIPREFRGFQKLTAVAINSLPFVSAIVKTDNGLKLIFLEQLTDDRFLVDWETDVMFQPVEWKDFLEAKPKQAVAMRVQVSKDNFYAYEFSDEAKYQCYRLTANARQQHVFAYVERDSLLMFKIENSFGDNPKPDLQRELILQIRYPEKGDSKRCVIIDKLLSNTWIYATPPEHEGAAKK